MIQASYTVTKEEWLDAQKVWSARNQDRLPGAYAQQIVQFLLFVMLGFSWPFLPKAMVPFSIASLALVIGFSYWRKRAIRAYLYSKATDREEPTELLVNETGYVSERPGFNRCEMNWKCFSGWREGASVFVLGRGVQFCIIPKRALSEAQQIVIRTLLTAKLV